MSLTSRYQYKKFKTLTKGNHQNSLFDKLMEIQQQIKARENYKKSHNFHQLLPPINNNSNFQSFSEIQNSFEEQYYIKQRHPYLDEPKPNKKHLKTYNNQKQELEVKISLQISKIELKELIIENQTKGSAQNKNSYNFNICQESKLTIKRNLSPISREKQYLSPKQPKIAQTDHIIEQQEFCAWPQISSDDY